MNETIECRTQCPFLDYNKGFCQLDLISCSKDFGDKIPPFCKMRAGKVTVRITEKIGENTYI